MEYDVVIGLEIHSELKTQTKVFCRCQNKFGQEQNTNCCPVCVGFPGALPILNKKAVELTIKAGLTVGCEINDLAIFERKNYFYPDLSKAYQISQLVRPICIGGGITLDSGKFIRLNRIHLEEDAGKLIHKSESIGTYIDYNRGGVPLIEMVTEPDISSAEEAVEFVSKLRNNLIFADIADCKMEEGGLRCDLNLSIKPKGSEKLGTRSEMKNLNSFKMIERAILNETKRQIDLLESGGVVKQETRKWDDNKGKSFSMRSKEDSQDYRYFPDPDILPVSISREFVENIRKTLPLLPQQRKQKYMEEYQLSEYDADILISEKNISDYFEKCVLLSKDYKQIANWIITEILRECKTEKVEDLSAIVSPKHLTTIISLINDKKLTIQKAKEVFAQIIFKTDGVDKIINSSISTRLDETQASEIIETVLLENPNAVSDFTKTPDTVMNYFVGQVMRKTKGNADAQLVRSILQQKLGG